MKLIQQTIRAAVIAAIGIGSVYADDQLDAAKWQQGAKDQAVCYGATQAIADAFREGDKQHTVTFIEDVGRGARAASAWLFSTSEGGTDQLNKYFPWVDAIAEVTYNEIMSRAELSKPGDDLSWVYSFCTDTAEVRQLVVDDIRKQLYLTEATQ